MGRTVAEDNFDLVAKTWLPPGWCEHTFHDDGTVESRLHLADHDDWPRRALPRSVVALLNGDITPERFNEIVASRAART